MRQAMHERTARRLWILWGLCVCCVLTGACQKTKPQPMRYGKTASQWASQLVSSNQHRRLQSVMALRFLLPKDSAAQAGLTAALNDKWFPVRAEAAMGLLENERNVEASLDALITCLGAPDKITVDYVLKALTDMTYPITSPLVAALAHEDESVRMGVARQIGTLAPKERSTVWKILMVVQENDTPQVQEAVAATFAHMGSQWLSPLESTYNALIKDTSNTFDVSVLGLLTKAIAQAQEAEDSQSTQSTGTPASRTGESNVAAAPTPLPDVPADQDK